MIPSAVGIAGRRRTEGKAKQTVKGRRIVTMTLDIVAQLGIAVLGVGAILLVGLKSEVRKWGFVCGLCAQPFWVYTTWTHEQWGIFLLTFIYGASWINGIRNHF